MSPKKISASVINNPCTRCGSQRIDSRTWTEKIETFAGVSTIVCTETVCPTPGCQEEVDKQLQAQAEKTRVAKEGREARMSKMHDARKKGITLHKATK